MELKSKLLGNVKGRAYIGTYVISSDEHYSFIVSIPTEGNRVCNGKNEISWKSENITEEDAFKNMENWVENI